MSCGEEFFITPEDLKNAKKDHKFEFGNKVLYDLCKEHPDHKDPEIAMAKIWLIGRSYAAAIERGCRNAKKLSSEEFYVFVGKKISKSPIDKWLDSLHDFQDINDRNIECILTVHGQLTNFLYKISDLKRRSLASKYLHFHFPELFFIFDNRAKTGLSKIKPRWMTEHNNKKTVADHEYEIFFKKIVKLRQYIKCKWQYNLSPREIDNLLLYKYNGKK